MDLFTPGPLLLALGMALVFWSMRVTLTAYPGQRVPLFWTAKQRPRWAYWLQIGGVALAGGSVAYWTDEVGFIGVIAPFVALLPWFLGGLLRNRRVLRADEVQSNGAAQGQPAVID